MPESAWHLHESASHGIFLVAVFVKGILAMKTSNTNDFGVVVKKTIHQYSVSSNGHIVDCTLSSRLRQELVYNPNATSGRLDQKSLHQATSPKWARGTKNKEIHLIEHVDPIAVGDQVEFAHTSDNAGQIVAVMPRRNRLARRTAVPMPDAHPFEQVIAANLDQIVPVFAAAKPTPKWNLLDRYLVSAESLDLPALICLTKLDLAQAKDGVTASELSSTVEAYRQIGYQVILTSAVTGAGLNELKAALQGHVSVLVGKSGVGKTSLLNALQPGLGLKVANVNQTTGKGRHTTSHIEMFSLEGGGAIIDTPGVREFGLWDMEVVDLAFFFPEMRPFVGRCRFGIGCRHEEEPGCAIRKAVVSGLVSPRRYQSYLHLKTEGYFYDPGY